MNIRANDLFTNKQALFQNQGPQNPEEPALPKEDRKSIFAGTDVNAKAYQAKKEAIREAVKIKLTAHAGETELDDTVEQLANRNIELEASVKAAQEEIAALDKVKEETESKGGEFAEYDTLKAEWQKQVDSGLAEMSGNRLGGIAITLERVKSRAMLDADATADKMMEAAAKETAGALFSEGVESIQEKFQEALEEAQKKAEEKAEQEEKIEEAKAESEAAKAGTTTEAAKESGAEDVAGAVTDVLSKEVRDMVKAQKLLEEDALGLVVDEVL